MRRLAAKIAFERFAQLRGTASLDHSGFGTVREFALIGNERESCCGVLSDPRLLSGPLNFPLPHHAVVIIEHPDDYILGAFVSFFALFYYWVVLSTRHRALAPMDDLLLEHPQARKVDNPLLRLGVGSVRVPWWELVTPYRQAPDAIGRAAKEHAKEKFQGAVDAVYGPQGGTPA